MIYDMILMLFQDKKCRNLSKLWLNIDGGEIISMDLSNVTLVP